MEKLYLHTHIYFCSFLIQNKILEPNTYSSWIPYRDLASGFEA